MELLGEINETKIYLSVSEICPAHTYIDLIISFHSIIIGTTIQPMSVSASTLRFTIVYRYPCYSIEVMFHDSQRNLSQSYSLCMSSFNQNWEISHTQFLVNPTKRIKIMPLFSMLISNIYLRR